jgi:hypothetical protein
MNWCVSAARIRDAHVQDFAFDAELEQGHQHTAAGGDKSASGVANAQVASPRRHRLHNKQQHQQRLASVKSTVSNW